MNFSKAKKKVYEYRFVILLLGIFLCSLTIIVRNYNCEENTTVQVTGKLISVETSTVKPTYTQLTQTCTQVTTTESTAAETITEDVNRYFLMSLGEFKITVYTPYDDNGKWGYQTVSGEQSKHLKTCAVDPDVIPLGSVIVVNGITIKAVDTSSAVKGNTIDIFFDGTETEAIEWAESFGDKAEVRLQYWGDYSEDHKPIN